MALEFGSGTLADPYLLVNFADVEAMFKSYLGTSNCFALVADLDISATTISYNFSGTINVTLDGRGNKLMVRLNNAWLAGTSYGNTVSGYWAGTFKNVHFKIVNAMNLKPGYSGGAGMTLDNAVFEFASNATAGRTDSIFKGSNSLIINGDAQVLSSASNIYKEGAATANTINTSTFSDGNKFNKSNYPTLIEQKWIFDGISLPHPRPQATADLTNRYCLKGLCKVGSLARQRKLAVFTENGLRVKVQDSAADGSFFLNLSDVTTPVIVLAYEDIGSSIVANTAYALNQIIHPAIPNGYRYRCTLAGNSGATLPAEPWPTAAVLTAGAAQFTPEPVFEPKAHGPLLPVLFNVLTEQPV